MGSRATHRGGHRYPGWPVVPRSTSHVEKTCTGDTPQQRDTEEEEKEKEKREKMFSALLPPYLHCFTAAGMRAFLGL